MVKHLQALWIVKDCGIVLYYKNNVVNIDNLFFGGLMGTLSDLVNITIFETVNMVRLDKYQLHFISRKILNDIHKLTFIGLFPIKKHTYQFIRDKRFSKEIGYIMTLFFSLYSEEDIQEWDFNINRFNEFSEYLIPVREKLAVFIDLHWPHPQYR